MKIKKIIAMGMGMSIALGSILGAIQVKANSSTDPFRISSKTLTAYVGTDTFVTLPNQVMIIGERAFEGNKNVKNVEFSDYVTEIQYKAFCDCTALEDVTLLHTVTKVGPGAFMGCTSLKSFEIGKSVKSWGSGVWNDCTSLTEVIIHPENQYLTYWDQALYNGDMSFLYQVLPAREGENYVVPSETKAIDTYAFYNLQNVKNVRFEGRVTTIPNYAMKHMGSVENVILPTSVEAIGKKAFADNENLKQVYIPKEVTSIADDIFSGSENVSILTSKGSKAEEYGKKHNIPVIYEKILPTDFVDSNPSNEGKPDLRKKIVVETDVDQLVDEIEKEEAKEEEAKPDESGEADTQKQYGPTFEETVTDSTNVIGKTTVVNRMAVFLMNNHTQKVYGTPSLQATAMAEGSIEDASFEWIYESGTVDYNLKSILQRSYYKNKDLLEYDIDDTIDNIGRLAFARSALKRISIPDSVVSIEYGAFYGCTDLEEIEIGNGVQSISTKVFAMTPWLENWKNGDWGDGDYLIIGDGILLAYRGEEENLTIPDTVKQIGPSAFLGNTDIVSVYLPESVWKIGMDAFKNCKNLELISGCSGLQQVVHGSLTGTKLSEELWK